MFVDLSTFYETICHRKLEEAALRLRCPMTLLNVAFQVYRGCRLLSAENKISPGAFAGQGILAGCPIAPALSKLALYDCCQRAHDSQYADTISVWLDDISGDVESKYPKATAARIYKFYSLLKEELGSAELQLSKDKTAFVCSDGETTRALKALLKPEDPKVVSVVKDLGRGRSSPQTCGSADTTHPEGQQEEQQTKAAQGQEKTRDDPHLQCQHPVNRHMGTSGPRPGP